MKTDEELLALAGLNTMKTVVCTDGAMYPIWAGRIQNPLDPRQLLRCMPEVGYGHAAKQVLDTCLAATQFLKAKDFAIIEKTKSGAARVIKANKQVHILGEVARRNGYIYPLLCTQLADETYDQANIEAWAKRGFHTPEKLDVVFTGTDGLGHYSYETPEYVYDVNYCTACFKATRKMPKYSTTTPKFVWQDKGESDED